ncbi:MAG: ATP-binding protein, partial [Chloroflexota bacterium]
MGFRYPALPVEHPDYGRAMPCVCTERTLEDQRESRLQRHSNLGPLVRMTFESLSLLGRSGLAANQQQFSRVVAAAQAFAAAPQGWLVLAGSPGSGKTHIAAAVANACIARGQPVLFAVVPDLLDHLRAAFAPTSTETYDELFEQVRAAPLLVLDDLGTHSSTAWAQEKLFQLLNHRYNAQ